MDEHFLFYAPPDHITDDRIVFPEEEAHHIATVLRKKAGDVVQATDGVGNTLEVRLDTVDKKTAAGEVTARFITPAEPDRILAMGVIRQRERLEFAIEKAVELGVTRIVLVHSEYAGKMEIKARRIEKTIITASATLFLTYWLNTGKAVRQSWPIRLRKDLMTGSRMILPCS
ncbi:MAG: RsmE family RNA methyltransferase [Bacteroidota bacterium]